MRRDGASQCDAVQSLASPWLFGREWLRSPLSVGAVAPSSARLADAMSQGLTATCGPVLELGLGTRVFTRPCYDAGFRQRRLP
jgi:phospholipid N-methyltransferase